MQATELRIGNIITDVFSENATPFEVVRFTTKRVWYKKGKAVYNCSIENLRGVLLTQDLLLECGFHKVYNETYEMWEHNIAIFDGISYFVLYSFSEGCFCFFDFRETPIAQGIEYVHQFQNLYYALTNTELKINTN